eukprot:CAMPEP_0117419356 /NCGR_PEP_ID=MMETSP0758-20121206/936_1 /TAXON_ID=63605 /ORGANISM="Percolomonas cosmopolitus, Strain AE-1 (ATCC 50343)" /LENGTH=487 /DNA_ID=CAMNT_0005200375 /DNA_START=69 /DNA_END=1532 /DNA_ORIENTATION=+
MNEGKKVEEKHQTYKKIIKEYEGKIEDGQVEKEKYIGVYGRITLTRSAGKKLYFFTIQDGEGKNIQLACSKANYEDENKFGEDMKQLKRGDIIYSTGYIGKTKKGELSLFPERVTLLAPCYHHIPAYYGFTDTETRFRNRHVDFIANSEKKDYFRLRGQLIRKMRDYFHDGGYLEVETPVLSTKSSGAQAKPFETEMNALHMPLKMRIAPELYLKQLIIGGFDKVFEIGKVFRNEGMDPTHNPEFTTCEFYAAYEPFDYLYETTETLIRELIQTRNAFYGEEELLTLLVGDTKIDFEQPFERIDYLNELEKHVDIQFDTFFEKDETHQIETLKSMALKMDIDIEEAKTVGSLLDKLFSNTVEAQLDARPVFITHHPVALSPLANVNDKRPYVTDRFELYIGGMEIANAYAELNNPFVQRERFAMQASEAVDDRCEGDEAFCKALEYGMPPTVGWGCGIDRIMMLLTQQPSIREILLFPLMKPIHSTF